jgi:predicted RNA-binding Zn-ribbon protein involved in translation (DUF1610 family)
MTEKNLDKSILEELIQKAQNRAQNDLQLGYQEHRAKSKDQVYWEVYWDAYDETKGDKYKRLICPSCGASGDAIKKVQDKSKIVDNVEGIPIYARKYVCKKCGFEF